MIKYHTLEDLKKKIVFKKIVNWDSDKLVLEDGTEITIECSEQDCCAWAGGSFKDVKLDAVITDIQIHDKGQNIFNGDGHDSYADVIIYHNQNEIAKAECEANDGNGGYYYSICALRVKDMWSVITQA